MNLLRLQSPRLNDCCTYLIPLFLTLSACQAEDHGGAEPLDTRTVEHLNLEDEPTCSECGVELREHLVLSDSAAPAGIREDAAGRDCMVARTSNGEWLLAGTVGGGQILWFDKDGGYTRSLGRRGEGPGEFGSDLRVMVGAGDSIYVLDDEQARLSVLTPSGEFVRSFVMPAQYRAVVRLPDGGFLFHRRPEGPTTPIFVRVDADGRMEGTFGQPRLEGAEAVLDTWLLAPAAEGGTWLASIWDYEIARHDPPGQARTMVTRTVEWFPFAPPRIDEAELDARPPSTLRHLFEDDSGRLWVFVASPSPNWEPGIPLEPRYEWALRSFESIVEVIDLVGGAVLARDRFPGLVGSVCGTSLLYTVTSGEGLDTRLSIMEPILVEATADASAAGFRMRRRRVLRSADGLHEPQP